MNRRKIRRGLCLINAAVIVAAIVFLPRETGISYTYSSELQRVIKGVLVRVPWDQVLATGMISLFTTVGVFLIIEGWHESWSADDKTDIMQENS